MFTRFVAKAGVLVLTALLFVACASFGEIPEDERVAIQVEELHNVLNGSFSSLPKSVDDCEVMADHLVGQEAPSKLWKREIRAAADDTVTVLGFKRIRFTADEGVCYGTAVLETHGAKLMVFTAVTLKPNRVWCYFSSGGPPVRPYHLFPSPWVAVECDDLWDDDPVGVVADGVTSGAVG